MAEITDQHRQEVSSGERFEFGRNWSRFLRRVNDERIGLAIASLQKMLNVDRLDGRTFLDVGSGSGLFSLAARRLGAIVHSFDYDPESVACTRALRERYSLNDVSWHVERGSVLDSEYLKSLGQFDVVYSWGVLHHTGAMARALDNVKPLVAQGGLLFIALYNDLGEITDRWAEIKQRYNQLGSPRSLLYAIRIVASEEWQALVHHSRNRNVGQWIRTWTDYDKVSTRGMSRWHDWIDWIGGYPYERASVEQIVDYFGKDGFRLQNLVDCSGGYGCNEFVFRRDGNLGTMIDARIPGGRSMLRRYGYRVGEPFETSDLDVVGVIENPPVDGLVDRDCVLFVNERLIGPVRVYEGHRVRIPAIHAVGAADVVRVVEGNIRLCETGFQHVRGCMWVWSAPDLAGLSDNMSGKTASPVFVFEDGLQLPMPHSIHDDIALLGEGRFSHWGADVLFSTRNGGDPNADCGRYCLVIAQEPRPVGA
jgi:2-polyprenyl-3-methyl-5-hydroxy-6-metoxy-1,4-benzoquinol methylase